MEGGFLKKILENFYSFDILQTKCSCYYQAKCDMTGLVKDAVLLVMKSKQCFALFFSTLVLYLHDCTKVSATLYIFTPQILAIKTHSKIWDTFLQLKNAFYFKWKALFALNALKKTNVAAE